jgi:diguanylate cyclase (GGDEF)-like protein
MLAPVSKVALRLLPGAVLLLCAIVALHPDGLRAAVRPLVPAFPLTVLVGGILLGWRFERSRLVLTLLTLLLAERALASWVLVGAEVGDTGRVIYGALVLLVPLNLAALAWLPERGLLAPPSRLAVMVLTAEVLLVMVLCQPLFLPLAGWIDLPRGPGLRALPQAGLVVFGMALVVLGRRALMQETGLESGAVWSLVAAFLALSSGGGGTDASLYLGTGGLILVISLIETWHGMAYDDELTGLPARRALNEALTRLHGTYTVAMVDIDHFKRFNDEHGHDVGDQLLRMVGARLGEIGGGGRAFRYGGEEFAVLFPGKDVKEARGHLELLRHRIETTPFTLRAPSRPRTRPEAPPAAAGRRRIAVTVSIGVAETEDTAASADEIVRAADEALYRAKQGGRNQIRT